MLKEKRDIQLGINTKLSVSQCKVMLSTYCRETPEERQKFEKEQVAGVLDTLRRSKSVAKKRAAEMMKKLEVYYTKGSAD